MSMFNILLIIAGVLEYILLGVDFKVRPAPLLPPLSGAHSVVRVTDRGDRTTSPTRIWEGS